jgi:hypothetical protein
MFSNFLLRLGTAAVLSILGLGTSASAPIVRISSSKAQAISPIAIAEDGNSFLWIAAYQGGPLFAGAFTAIAGIPRDSPLLSVQQKGASGKGVDRSLKQFP